MITSLHNARVKAARQLTSRKERYAARQILVEGVRLIADAWQSGVEPIVVFYDPALVAANPMVASLLEELRAAGRDCLACAPAVFATLTDTVTPQGIAAVLPFPALPAPGRLTLVLVLDAVRDPGNAGTLLRSAAAAGVDLVVFGPNTVDPYNEKVLRAAMGAHFRVPLRLCATWDQVQAALGAYLPLYLADATADLGYAEVDWRQPAALVVGGEAGGAGVAAQAAATPIAIPMHGAVESLNAAIAGSVILFEAARQRKVADRTG